MTRHILHLPIPVLDSKTRRPELVEFEPIGDHRYRVVCPPRFTYGLAVGDEIELDEREPSGFCVVRRSRNLTIWFYVARAGDEGELADAARPALDGIGATLEGTPPQMMIVTVPLTVGWSRIESVMNAICATVDGVSWEYANVYDPVDGKTPLGWWDRE